MHTATAAGMMMKHPQVLVDVRVVLRYRDDSGRSDVQFCVDNSIYLPLFSGWYKCDVAF